MRRFVLLCGALLPAAALLGCHSGLDVDVSKGNYGKASTETKLPPQPDPQEVIRRIQKDPSAAARLSGMAPAAATPARGK
jgi:hypothetical protein